MQVSKLKAAAGGAGRLSDVARRYAPSYRSNKQSLLRRTKVVLIYSRMGNLRAVQLLLGHSKIESTVRYLGTEVDDAIKIAERQTFEYAVPLMRTLRRQISSREGYLWDRAQEHWRSRAEIAAMEVEQRTADGRFVPTAEVSPGGFRSFSSHTGKVCLLAISRH